jgi:adenylate cyclase
MLKGHASPEGELREVTVLFSDIRGFTSLSETVPAREVVALINDYLSTLVPPITENGGVVDKFVGDEIFAVFGAPIQLPNDALAAVRAAILMKDRLAALNDRRAGAAKPPIAIGIGINTGAVVAGAVGSTERRNYTVMGAAVNQGARLCSAATPGQVLISRTTYYRVQDHVRVRELPPLTVKGIPYSLSAFEVLGWKAQDDA